MNNYTWYVDTEEPFEYQAMYVDGVLAAAGHQMEINDWLSTHFDIPQIESDEFFTMSDPWGDEVAYAMTLEEINGKMTRRSELAEQIKKLQRELEELG